jgi:hypothetical protein
VLFGLGLAFSVVGISLATASDDAVRAGTGAVLMVVGGSLLLTSAISGLVRRSNRGKFQRRIDQLKGEKQSLDLQLALGVSRDRQVAGLTLRF